MFEPKTAAQQHVLTLTPEELTEIATACAHAQEYPYAGARLVHPQKQSVVHVVWPALRNGPEIRIADFHCAGQGGGVGARLLLAAAKYLHLLPAAVELIRESQQAKDGQ